MRNKTILFQSSRLVVSADHLFELAGSQSYALSDASGQSLAQQPRRQPIILWLPSFALIEESFSYLNPLADSAQWGHDDAYGFLQDESLAILRVRQWEIELRSPAGDLLSTLDLSPLIVIVIAQLFLITLVPWLESGTTRLFI